VEERAEEIDEHRGWEFIPPPLFKGNAGSIRQGEPLQTGEEGGGSQGDAQQPG
jgi:hypothetical protein